MSMFAEPAAGAWPPTRPVRSTCRLPDPGRGHRADQGRSGARRPSTRNDRPVGSRYYNYNNGVDPSGEGKLARCQDEKTCPTANKDFRIALTQAIDKHGLHRRHLRRDRHGGQQLRHAGHPWLRRGPRSVSVRPRRPPRPAWTRPWRRSGTPAPPTSRALKFGFNTGAGHEPRVAFLAQAWTEAFGLKTEQIGTEFGVFLTQRTAGEYDIARNGWGADYPHANNQLNGLFTLRWRQQRQPVLQPGLRRPAPRRPRRAGPGGAGRLYEQAQKIMADDAAISRSSAGTSSDTREAVRDGRSSRPRWTRTVPGDHFYETIQILEH